MTELGAVTTARRLYLLMRVGARGRLEFGLESALQYLQTAEPGRQLPVECPGWTLLVAAGYVTVEDVAGATFDELQLHAGLRRSTANAAILAATGKFSMGYTMLNGRWADTKPLTVAAAVVFAAGQTVGSAVETDGGIARLALDVQAITGTNPTLDVDVLTSHDGVKGWRYVASFVQKTAAARSMSTVVEAGTTPPDLTITGKPNKDISLKVVCTKAGARGTFEVKISIDGGVTYGPAVVSAASGIAVSDPATGAASGLTIGFEDVAAAVDNVWTSSSGYQMGAVTAAGTTPPTVTLTGVANRSVDLRIECTTLGARGTAVLRYSIDGGKTWKSSVTTAATISVLDPANADADTGLVINYANAAAAVDNVWTAKMSGFERKVLTGLDRFVRVTANVGGTSTPTATVQLDGEAV